MIRSIILRGDSNQRSELFFKAAERSLYLDVIGTFDKVDDCISFLVANRVDIFFVDISHANTSAFNRFQKDFNTAHIEMVFLVSQEEMTLSALNLSALYFIEAPFADLEFERIVEKFRRKKCGQDVFLESQRISVPVSDGWEIIEIDKLIYFKADSNYTDLFLEDGSKRKASKPLKHFAKLLSQKNFVRIHQSFLVNTRFMKKLSKDRSPSLFLTNNLELPVSRSGKKELRRLFSI